MSEIDLGQLEGHPLLCFGGPYSNLSATRALIAEADQLGIPAANRICTGDVVAYCAEAEETVQTLRDWDCRVLMGNCEESLSQGAEDCGCGFSSGSACDRLSAQWFAHAMQQLSPGSRQWMGQLPRLMRFRYGDWNAAVVHGSHRQINEFVFASEDPALRREALRDLDCQLIIAGHSGIPFVESHPEGVWLNAGAIGMPANDGTPDTWYSVLELNRQGALRVNLRRLRYDPSGSEEAMKNAPLGSDYRKALRSGLWPSQDVLPEPHKNQRGTALAEKTRMFFLPALTPA